MEEPFNRRIQEPSVVKIGNLAVEPEKNRSEWRMHLPGHLQFQLIFHGQSRVLLVQPNGGQQLLYLLEWKRQDDGIRAVARVCNVHAPTATLLLRNSFNTCPKLYRSTAGLDQSCSIQVELAQWHRRNAQSPARRRLDEKLMDDLASVTSRTMSNAIIQRRHQDRVPEVPDRKLSLPRSLQ